MGRSGMTIREFDEVLRIRNDFTKNRGDGAPSFWYMTARKDLEFLLGLLENVRIDEPCPKCGKIGTLFTNGQQIWCKLSDHFQCGWSGSYDEYKKGVLDESQSK
jgi:hypothetical protein